MSDIEDQRTICISLSDLTAWIVKATPGASIEYHRGEIGFDCITLVMSNAERKELRKIRDLMWAEMEAGTVCLTQKRVGQRCFSYIATARRDRTPQPMRWNCTDANRKPHIAKKLVAA